MTYTDWLQHGLRQLTTATVDLDTPRQDTCPVPEHVADAFFQAALSGDYLKALELAGNDTWVRLVQSSAKRLENDWTHKTIDPDLAVGGFWTLSRVFQRLSTRAELSPPHSAGRGDCLIWVPPGDAHTFGASVLADRFAQTGWSTALLTHAPTDVVISHLANTDTDILGISIGCDEHFFGVADFLRDARITSLNPNLTIMAGGPAFAGELSQYGFLGADILAHDVDTALGQVDKRCDA